MKPQRILITGASRGIGAALAAALHADGHTVFATARRVADVAAPVDGLERWHALPLDVCDDASVQAAAASVQQLTQGQGLDALINNAGYAEAGPVEQVSARDCARQFETNVTGILRTVQAFAPAMRASGRGRIVNIGSLAGRIALPFMGVYSASKFAVAGLSDALRLELKPFGIQVVLIEPGVIATEFAQAAYSRSEASAAYAALYRPQQLKARNAASGASPQAVVAAVREALTTPSPKARMIAPPREVRLLWMKALLGRRFDAVLAKRYGLKAQPGV